MSETLDLSAVFDRDDVKLRNGIVYEIRNPQEFGIIDDHRLNALIRRVDEAQKNASSDDATEEDATQAADLLRELATLLLIDLPDDAEIGDWESVAIFDFHMKKRVERARKLAEEAGVKLPPLMAPPKSRKPRTTAKSSRGSKRSTAATRKRGS